MTVGERIQRLEEIVKSILNDIEEQSNYTCDYQRGWVSQALNELHKTGVSYYTFNYKE